MMLTAQSVLGLTAVTTFCSANVRPRDRYTWGEDRDAAQTSLGIRFIS
jgi:hypothetical protein